MDFDPSVVGIGSQPFWFHWYDGERERRHAPDSSRTLPAVRDWFDAYNAVAST
ncbi:hypothetical protein [Streptomyces sp. STR69]|uniref:hypothetical protein n=1 Tax=Streptomyces sp. STR69 TaxID=1796942 RepID=UPI002905C318|nr:hypothetical protein [Streptomyces sp. STR69]